MGYFIWNYRIDWLTKKVSQMMGNSDGITGFIGNRERITKFVSNYMKVLELLVIEMS